MVLIPAYREQLSQTVVLDDGGVYDFGNRRFIAPRTGPAFILRNGTKMRGGIIYNSPWIGGQVNAAVHLDHGTDAGELSDTVLVDCSSGVNVLGGDGTVIERVRYEFTIAPAATACAYGLYIGGGSNLTVNAWKGYGSRLDMLKVALLASGTSFDACEVELAGVSPTRAALWSGVTAQEGGAVDAYASGNLLHFSRMRSKNCYGNACTFKTTAALNPPSVAGDVVINGWISDGDTYGYAGEAIDVLVTPSVGVRPETQRHILNAMIVKNNLGAAFYVNTRHVQLVGCQAIEALDEGVVFYAHSLDCIATGMIVRGCGKRSAGTKPGVRITGGNHIQWIGGIIDGQAADGVNYSRSAMEIFDYDVTHTADNLRIDMPDARNWTASSSPPIAFFCTPTTAIVDHYGDELPTGTPGRHGGKGSTYRRTNDGNVYRKTDAASSKVGWVAM